MAAGAGVGGAVTVVPVSRVVPVAVIAVTVLPGATAFTRMPCGPSSFATDLVRPITPCLAAV